MCDQNGNFEIKDVRDMDMEILANMNEQNGKTHTQSLGLQHSSELCKKPRSRSNTDPSLVQNVKGILLILVMFLSSLLAVCCFNAVLLPFSLVRATHALYRRAVDALVYSWILFDTALLELLLGVRIVVTGDAIRPGERNLIIMNHRTRLDWMFFWSVLVRESGVSTEKIILKSPLKKIPGAGWAMQVGAFMFINRKWEEDKVILSKMIDYFANIKHRTQVLLFPEGTDLTARTKSKSDEFAKKNGVDPFEYVLHPRTTGFTYLTQYMRQKSHLDAVYDVTIGYPVNIPQNESDLAKGNFPKEVHFHIKRHAVQSLPLSEDGLQEWCKLRWQEKEHRLKAFYEQRHFTDPKTHTQAAGDGDRLTDVNPTDAISSKIDERTGRDIKARRLLKLALVYWTVFVVAIIVLLVYSSVVRYYSLFQIVFFIFMGHKYGGFELFQVDYFNRFFSSKRSQKKEQ